MTVAKPRTRVRVLLVDDEPLICRVIERLLGRHEQFEVRSTTDYRAALYVFETEGPFDILLTDLQMPGVSGLDLAKQILKLKPDLRVVLMSGDISSHEPAEFATIQKPFDPGDLVEKLESVLLAPHGKLK
jgi:DNA-binding NtrC family response regulator